MSIQPVNSVPTTFTGQIVKTDKGNEYKKSNTAKKVGFGVGLVLAGGLMHSQIKALKTIAGKRNIVEGFHLRNKNLNDITPKVISRGEDGKIIPPENNVSKRTKNIVNGFKKTLALFGAGITAITTGIGAYIDSTLNSVKAREADERAAKKA